MRSVILLIIITATTVALSACTDEFTNPPTDILEHGLYGVWISDYARGVSDILIIKPDGTYKQFFKNSEENYLFDSGWQKWTLEHVSEGFARLHLQQGRYYLEGIAIGETNGRKSPENPCLGDDCTWGLEPRIFYDPFRDETIQMVDELLLVPLVDANGDLILHHVWISSDRGFAIIGGNRELFERQMDN